MTSTTVSAPPDFRLPLRARDELLARGAIDAARWRSDLIDLISSRDPQVRAFADWHPWRLEDQRVPAVPTVTYKDTIDVAGCPTRLGVGAGYRHYPRRSARIVAHLARLNFVTIGKTATTEVSIGTRMPSRNPNYPQVSSGGSSSGAGAAVAAGFCDLGVGTDSGGSIRWPAVYCGVVGLRLTHATEWLDGLLPVAPSMESIGLVTRTVDDLRHLWLRHGLSTLTGRRTSRDRLRVGVIADLDDVAVHPEVRAAFDACTEALAADGCQFRTVSPSWWHARADAWDLLLREAFEVHRGRDTSEYDPATRAVLDLGSAVADGRLAAVRALQRRVGFDDDVDVVVLPLDADLADPPPDPNRTSTVPSGDPGFTIGASFAGLPVIALPVGHATNGSPLGIQIVARAHHEDLLIQVAHRVEQLRGHDGRGGAVR